MQGTDMTDARLFMLQGAEQEALLVNMVTHGLNRDVLPLKPTVVTIDFGMNDARRGDAAVGMYRRGLEELTVQLQKAGARVVLLAASPEERSQPGEPAGSSYNKMLEKYAGVVREVAEKTMVPYVDQLHPYIEVVDRARKSDPAFKTMPDGVHPHPSGHLVMAWAILKGMGADAIVSEVTIDVGAGPGSRSLRARVTELSGAGGGVAFNRDDDALPWPLPKAPNGAEVVLPYTPILNDLSRYILRVTGLKEGNYDLFIDAQKVATVPGSQLAEGWNLTTAETPMSAQAAQLMQTVIEKNNMFFNRWRQTLVPAIIQNQADDPAVKTKLDEADRRIAELEAEIERLRRPKVHRFEIKPV
jgi:hypothetical protein